tara:strand:+ start:83969 stop:84550 length:582 start_codon:yes stop_codon:yes gene_type:complete
MSTEFKIGKLSNLKLIQELVSDIPGLNYHSDFLTDKSQQQILDVLDTLDYQVINGRPTKYFGLNYTHRKKTHDSKKEEIPLFFDLLKPLNIKFDQLVIEYYRRDDGHHYLNESDLFSDDIIILPIGSCFKYDFVRNDKSVSFLVEPKSLLLISGESRKWKRSIRPRIKERFNSIIIPRTEFYVLTFRNIKTNI